MKATFIPVSPARGVCSRFALVLSVAKKQRCGFGLWASHGLNESRWKLWFSNKLCGKYKPPGVKRLICIDNGTWTAFFLVNDEWWMMSDELERQLMTSELPEWLVLLTKAWKVRSHDRHVALLPTLKWLQCVVDCIFARPSCLLIASNSNGKRSIWHLVSPPGDYNFYRYIFSYKTIILFSVR